MFLLKPLGTSQHYGFGGLRGPETPRTVTALWFRDVKGPLIVPQCAERDVAEMQLFPVWEKTFRHKKLRKNFRVFLKRSHAGKYFLNLVNPILIWIVIALFNEWFSTKWIFVLCQINRKSSSTIQIWFGLTRSRKHFSGLSGTVTFLAAELFCTDLDELKLMENV